MSATSSPPTPRSEGEILQSSNLNSFTFNDLRAATRNFRPDSMLGEGGFGSVFKGWIDENTFTATKPGTGMVIAVKRLNQDGYQGHREWLVSVPQFPIFNFETLPTGSNFQCFLCRLKLNTSVSSIIPISSSW